MNKRQQRRRTARRRTHAIVAGGGAAVIGSLGSAGVAHAAQTFTVSNLNDSGQGSLRAAIEALNGDAADTSPPGDSIVFASGLSGTLSLTTKDPTATYSSLHAKRPVQIVGPGAGALTIHAAPNTQIFDFDAAAELSGLTLTGGAVPHGSAGGGAIFANGALELDSMVITGNTSYRYGGGVEAYSGHLTVRNSTISDNKATNASANPSGGGIDDAGAHGATETIVDSNISGNSASTGAGGISFDGGTANVIDSTITGNTAPAGAGLVAGDAALTVTDSTVAANNPTGQGGQVATSYHLASVTLQDSIIAGGGSQPDVNLATGSPSSSSFSLIRNATTPVGGAPLSTDSSDQTGVDPKLAPLAPNGGSTETMVPLPNSPVLDAGKSFGVTSDERGLSRPFTLPTITSVPAGGDRSDIGAVEEHTAAVASAAPGSGGPGTQVTITGTGFTGAIRVLFGKTAASSFTVVNDATIVAVAPAHAGRSDIRVVTPLGESPVATVDRFSEPNVAHVRKAKHKRRTLDTGLELICPAGGSSCSARVVAKLHGKQVGRGKVKRLHAGASKGLKLKLSLRGVPKLRKGHHKLTLTIVVTDGNSRPLTIHKTITL